MNTQSSEGFVWTDELVKDFVRERIIAPCDYLHTQLDDRVDSFKIKHTNTYTSKDNLKSGSNVAGNEKKVLFITEDGKDVFEGDVYWYVSKKAAFLRAWEIESTNQRNKPINVYGIFSTELAAHQYVSENKPQFSIKDFKDTLGKFDYADIEDIRFGMWLNENSWQFYDGHDRLINLKAGNAVAPITELFADYKKENPEP